MYQPPYTISAYATEMIHKIISLVEQYSKRKGFEDNLRLRKANRIKTIHSSLAIEGNILTENEVATILEGKTIIAPLKDIQEVKNAKAVYDVFNRLNPYKIEDLLKAHALMMDNLTADAGKFRTKGVGVFAGDKCIHMAPKYDMVNGLMNDLFAWLKGGNEHLIIKSCVFHYEFEFIHPFIDGNGRIGRLWQSLILAQYNPIFAHLPIENMVYSSQEGYYKAIADSSTIASSSPFIDFMVSEIYKALNRKNNRSETDNETNRETDSDTDKKLIALIKRNNQISYDDMAISLNLSRSTVSRIVKRLVSNGKLIRHGNTRNGYWEIKK